MLNLGTSVPCDLEQITMKGRRTLRPFNTFDETFYATCKTSKVSLAAWLKTADFAVIYCCGDSLWENQNLFSHYNSLPKEITNNEINYGIQLSFDIADSPQISVHPIDDKNVMLYYNFDWN